MKKNIEEINLNSIILKIEEAVGKLNIDDTRESVIVFLDLTQSTYYKYEHKFVEGYRKTKLHNEIIKHFVNEFGGVVIKEIGDEVLAVFEDCIKCVRFSIFIQNTFNQLNNETFKNNPEEKIFCKIGIHQGRILIEDGDIFGSAVDFAARVISLASDGQIVISDVVKNSIGKEFRLSKPYNVNLKGLGSRTVFEVIYDWERGVKDRGIMLEEIMAKVSLLEQSLKGIIIPNQHGIKAIYPNQREVQNKLSQLNDLSQPPESIKIMAITGMKIWTNNDFIDFFLKSNTKFEILLLAPKSRYVGIRVKEYHNYSEKSMRLEIEAAIAKLSRLRKDHEARIDIRVYDDPPVFRLLAIDKIMYIGGYLQGISSVKSVIYNIEESDSSLFSYFEKYFNYIFEKSEILQ